MTQAGQTVALRKPGNQREYGKTGDGMWDQFLTLSRKVFAQKFESLSSSKKPAKDLTLILRHVGDEHGEPRFTVNRQLNENFSDPVSVTPPESIDVEGRPDSNLLLDLRWYIENYPDLLNGSNRSVAERVLIAINNWGETTFRRLFARQTGEWYQDDRQSEDEQSARTLKIASDDPRILAWPWELLRDPKGVSLAHNCRIERRLSEHHDPLPLSKNLPRNRINILLAAARPYDECDVRYHALYRPLLNLARKRRLPIDINVLRPPSFARLQAVLKANPNFYHIILFDGHVGYDSAYADRSPHFPNGVRGELIFETAKGEEDPIRAEKFAELMIEYPIPITILNAYQSDRMKYWPEDAFASVAATLLKAGVRNVVTVGCNLQVNGAQRYLPNFFRQLFKTGDTAEAVRAGRKAMLSQPGSINQRVQSPLQDWTVPALYQQEPLVLDFADRPVAASMMKFSLPDEAQPRGNYGFIGRNRAIHMLERVWYQQPQAGILIHGMAGIGKTTLAQGLLAWLRDTHGLSNHPFWFDFETIHSADHIINRLAEALFGNSANALGFEQKLQALIEKFKEQPFLIVWDNFESAAGIDGADVNPLSEENDLAALDRFLKLLLGGQTKVLITSRSDEAWLDVNACHRFPLNGFQKEERWEYCDAVVHKLGLNFSHQDQAIIELIDILNGHPLTTSAVLSRLQYISASTLLAQLKTGMEDETGCDGKRKMFTALRLLETAFPDHYGPILQLVGLHQSHVDIEYLETMAKDAHLDIDRASFENAFSNLESGGLLHSQGQGIYAMHPALRDYLLTQHPPSEALQNRFVDFMEFFAGQLATAKLQEQWIPFALHGANFHRALLLAKDLDRETSMAALTQAMAAYAQNKRDFREAARLANNLLDYHKKLGNEEGIASAYRHLGIIAQAEQDFPASQTWYQKSLAIEEKCGNEKGTAKTYHQLGIAAQLQQDLSTAQSYYQKSLAISEKLGDEQFTARTYDQLGSIAQLKHELRAAHAWYKKSLAIKEILEDERGAAIIYHQLGMIKQAQMGFRDAQAWYQKSLAIDEKYGNEHGAARTFHQLGIVAQIQRDFSAAHDWYQRSLMISENLGDENVAALTCYQLGAIAYERRDLSAAAKWLIRSALIFSRTEDDHQMRTTVRSYARLFSAADKTLRPQLEKAWRTAGLENVTSVNNLKEMAHEML